MTKVMVEESVYPLLSLLIIDIPVCVDLYTPTFTNVSINNHICCLQVAVHLATMLAANVSRGVPIMIFFSSTDI